MFVICHFQKKYIYIPAICYALVIKLEKVGDCWFHKTVARIVLDNKEIVVFRKGRKFVDKKLFRDFFP